MSQTLPQERRRTHALDRRVGDPAGRDDGEAAAPGDVRGGRHDGEAAAPRDEGATGVDDTRGAAQNARRPAGPPPRHRLALLVWIAIYPTITLLLELGGPVINDWPLPVRTLALTAIAVPLMVFVLLPALQRTFAGWLTR